MPKLNNIFIVILLTFFCYICHTEQTDETAPVIIDLDEEEFQPFITKNDPVMVMFYSPNCGHCNKMKPEYEKLSGTLQKMGIKAQVARVDGTENSKLLSDQQIEGFPTLKLYTQKMVHDYKGERTSQAISKWIKKVTKEPIIKITNDTNVEADSDEGYFIGYFEDENSDLYKQFNKIASENRLLSSFFAVIPSLKSKIIAVKEDEDKIEYNGQTEKDLLQFINTEAYPKLAIVSPSNFEKFLSRNLPFGWFEGKRIDYETYSENIRKVSREFKNEITFVWVDSDLYSPSGAEYSGATFMLNLINGTRYELVDAVKKLSDFEALKTFLQDANAGKIAPYLKSQEIPASNNEPVKVVVGKNFMETVFQSDKDVLLEVYAPWCGHCKQLEPVYVEVAKHFSKTPNVIIAKMDGTANDSPTDKIIWRGFPSLFFVKAGTDVVLDYSGDRSKDSIINFINENGSKFPSSTTTADEL